MTLGASPRADRGAPSLLIAGVDLGGRRADVVVRDGVIAEVAAAARRSGGAGPIGRGTAERIDGAGRALLPGLHDHHVHLLATAAARWSLDVGDLGPGDGPRFAAAVRERLPADPGGELRVIGYDDAVAGALDRHVLDVLAPGRAVRVQHRTGQRWSLSTAALDRLGLLDAPHEAPAGFERDASGIPTGRCWRVDGWLRERRASGDAAALATALASVAEELLGHGVTGCTDTTPFASPADAGPLLDAVTGGALAVRLTLTGGPGFIGAALPTGVRRGPVKLLVDDHDPAPFDELTAGIAAARAAGSAVAVHCVTRAGLALAIAAIDAAGPVAGDRIEHGAVVAPDAIPELARLGITVVTQPAFLATRGDRYLRDVDPDDTDHLWPCASLLAAGIPVAAGSDAPYGPLDPWVGISAATRRTSAAGRRVGADEPLTGRAALALYLGHPEAPGRPRRIAPGVAADLVLLDRPLAEAEWDPSTAGVAAVVVGGRRVS